MDPEVYHPMVCPVCSQNLHPQEGDRAHCPVCGHNFDTAPHVPLDTVTPHT